METIVKLKKSSRHSKITGNFAESLVLYWLSKYGFECANVDHTGIDIIARNPTNRELMGISVKSRSRNEGTETSSVTVDRDQFKKVKEACLAFGCKPYLGVVVDAKNKIMVFILSVDKLLTMAPKGNWKMRDRDIELYYNSKDIKVFEFTSKTHNWWKQ